MKLIRFGEPGQEKPDVLLNDGTRIDASGLGSDYDESFFESGGLAKLDTWLRTNGLSASYGAIGTLGSSYLPAQQDCMYRPQLQDHAAESKMELPKEPVSFFKSTTSLVGPNDPLVIPKNTTKVETGRLSWRSSLGEGFVRVQREGDCFRSWLYAP